jgi:aerobic carbon-monoxide dehydrogenase medium subunit
MHENTTFLECVWPRTRIAFKASKNPASGYAIVGVFVAHTRGGVRVAVTGVKPRVFRVPEMEAALAKSFTPDAIEGIAIPDSGLNSNRHSGAERARLVDVARRAIAACGQSAAEGPVSPVG